MSDALFTVVTFVLKLALVIICSPLIGGLGLVTVPFRLWQAVTGRLTAASANLASPAKASALAGVVVIFAASIGWARSIYEIFQAVTCTSSGCALAGLGVFFVLSLFGSVYGFAELLLFPATFPRTSDV